MAYRIIEDEAEKDVVAWEKQKEQNLGKHVKRHSKQSFVRWNPTEMTDEADDMQKAYDYMKDVEQGKESNAMKQTLTELQEKQKRSSKNNWIVK